MEASGFTLPPSGFASRRLDLFEVATDSRWLRLYRRTFTDPLGFGYGPSRFSDPETRLVPPDRFGVVYLGSTLKVCFLETILRDRGEGRLGALPIAWRELEGWSCAALRIARSLRLVDLRGDCLVRMGIPTDVARARSQDVGRVWSRAIWDHDLCPDGIIYESRLNAATNIAAYDRALGGLEVVAARPLVEHRGELAGIIRDFELAIVWRHRGAG